MAYSNLSTLDFFGYLQTSKDMISVKNSLENIINNEYDRYTQLVRV